MWKIRRKSYSLPVGGQVKSKWQCEVCLEFWTFFCKLLALLLPAVESISRGLLRFLKPSDLWQPVVVSLTSALPDLPLILCLSNFIEF